MDINSNKYVFTFAAVVCVLSAVLLSAVSKGLSKQQELNAELDVKKNILKAVSLKDPVSLKAKPQDVLKVYSEKIQEVVIDEQGNVLDGRKPSEIKESETNLHPLYVYREGDETVSYAFPIVGQGLWSTMYGYMAIESDAVTVRGVTFYKHGETPGLGAEIEKDWFQKNFVGKKIWSLAEKKLTPIIVVKGKVEGQFAGTEAEYRVDGITAATLTGNGVTDLIYRWLKIYEIYLSKVRTL